MATERQDQERRTDPRARTAWEARVTRLFRDIFRPNVQFTAGEPEEGPDQVDGSDDDLPPAA